MTIKFTLCIPELIINSTAILIHMFDCNYYFRFVDRLHWPRNWWIYQMAFKSTGLDSIFGYIFLCSFLVVCFLKEKCNVWVCFCTAHNCVNNTIVSSVFSYRDENNFRLKLTRSMNMGNISFLLGFFLINNSIWS